MKKHEALRQIKTLRDAVNGTAEPWVNAVVWHLDAACDAIEKPASVHVSGQKTARTAISTSKSKTPKGEAQ